VILSRGSSTRRVCSCFLFPITFNLPDDQTAEIGSCSISISPNRCANEQRQLSIFFSSGLASSRKMVQAHHSQRDYQ
jgi:hypothetical protein